jgi:hypothetical protein
MRRLRRHLGSVAGVWLLFQACTLMAAPISMCAGAVAVVVEGACTCPAKGATECPMHHPAASNSTSSCSCRSTTDPTTSAIASLLGPIAVLPPSVDVGAAVQSTDSVPPLVATAIDGLALPDAPPPRC